MKAALVYDRVNKWGGAERVLLALRKIFPNVPLYTSVYNKKNAQWADNFDIKTSFLQSIPNASLSHEILAPLMPIAFESFNFDEFDLVISITSEAAKGIITKQKTKHICYCLTPTRYLWSGYNEYFKNQTFKILSKPIVSYLRAWDKVAAQRPDSYITISKEVQSRIKKYYDRESEIVYPPIEISNFKFQISNLKKNEGYFLIVSRLVPYKKIDLAIRVFNKLKLPLKIIGTGSELEKLKEIAGPTVEFLGLLTDKELVEYYIGCQALIFPGYEDFGLTILEAQSFGKPIICFKGGGALETVIENKTGIFFGEQNIESLENSIKKFNNMSFDPVNSIKNAKKFSFEIFKNQFLKEIDRVISP